MSDFDLEPLIRGAKDPLIQEVLGAAKEERPAGGARGRALAALGLSGALTTALPASATPVRRSITTRLGDAFGVKGAIGLASIAVLGAVAAFGSAFTDHSPPPEPPRTETPHGQAPPSPAPEKTATAATVITPEMLPSSEAPSAPRAPAPRSPATAAPTPRPAIPTSTLARETALVDAAGLALSRGLPGEALKSLDAYDHEFPTGAFVLEIAVLRIEALARAGRAAEADHLAADFLAKHPTGPHARRVQAAQSHR